MADVRVGADARLKSDLILAILEQKNPDAKVEFTKADAEALFAKFPQWKGFLVRKREILSEKEKAADERRAKREADTKARADAAKEDAAKEATGK